MSESNEMDKLVKKAIKGSTRAYGQLAHMYQEYLYRTAYLYVRNEQDALDVVQECVLKGYENIRSLRQPEHFKTWLTRILINCAAGFQKKRLPAVSMEAAGEVEAGKTASVEEKWDLYEAIDVLPEKYKTVIILKYYHDMKIQEIACAMDIPEGSVKAYLTRAKQELRQHLKEDYRYAR